MKRFRLRALSFSGYVFRVAVVGLLPITTAAVSADDERILTLTVRETLGISRTNAAVSSGVPFPEGRLKERASLGVKGPSGEILPSQFDVLARWDDGSVKWILVSTIVPELAPRGAFKLAIVRRPSATDNQSRERGVEITKRARGVRVRYPGLSVETNSLGIPESVLVVDGKVTVELVGDGSQLLLDEEIVSPAQAKVADIRVEEHGPVRTVVRTEGTISLKNGKSFTYLVRNRIFANGEISTAYSVINRQIEGFSRYGVLLPLTAGFRQALIHRQETPLGNEAIGVRQTERETAVFHGQSSSERSVRQRYHGGLRLTGKSKTLGLAIDDFWQRYPSALSVTSRQARLLFYPEEEKPVPFYRVGRAARGDFTIIAAAPGAVNWSVAQSGATRLQAFAGPEWYCKSRVLGQYASGDVELASGSYHAYLDKLLDFLRRRKIRFNEFGFWNFGDERAAAKSDFWRNNEFGIAFAMLFHYLRTGDLRFFEDGVSFARHFRDTDTLHHGYDKGKSMKHTDHHVEKGEYNVGHQWVEGILLDYLLTGDRRSLEVAREMAVHLIKYAREMSRTLKTRPRIVPTQERYLGWTLLSLMFLEEVTGDEQYADALKLLVDGVVAAQDPKRGHWPRSLRDPHPDYETGGATFMVGVLTEALMRYHERTGDESVARSLIKASYWLSDEMWNPEEKSLRYKQMASAWNAYNDGRTIPLVLPGMIYARHLGRNDKRYRTIVDQTLERYDGLCADLEKLGEGKLVDHTGDNGRSFKSLAMMSRSMPRFFYYYQRSQQTD